MKSLAIVTLSVSLFISGCNAASSKNAANPTPTPNPLIKAAEEEKATEDNEEPENRIEVRKAASEYIIENMPGWKIDGISVLSYAGTAYSVTVDVSHDKEKKHKVVELSVRLYTKENGEKYWRANPLDRTGRKVLDDIQYTRLSAAYNRLLSENEELSSENEELKNPEPPEDDRDYDPRY